MFDILLHFSAPHGWQPQILDNGIVVAAGKFNRYYDDATAEAIKLLGKIKFESITENI